MPSNEVMRPPTAGLDLVGGGRVLVAGAGFVGDLCPLAHGFLTRGRRHWTLVRD